MQRTISLILVGFLSFLLGVASTFAWARYSQPRNTGGVQPSERHESEDERPILAFCELANNPDKYSGRTVRVSTSLSGFIHGMVLYDPNCSSVHTQTAVFYQAQKRIEIEAALKQARGSEDWRLPVQIIAEGEFRKVIPSNQSDTIYDTAPLQFEIIRVEKASKLD